MYCMFSVVVGCVKGVCGVMCMWVLYVVYECGYDMWLCVVCMSVVMICGYVWCVFM